VNRDRRKWWRQSVLAGAILILAACGGNEPQIQQVNTPSLVPLTPIVRATLPPAWTSTPSTTPSLTPTATITPTVTPTFTITPTLAAEEVCEQFALTGAPSVGASFSYDAIIGFSWDGAPPDSVIVLSLIDHQDEEVLLQFPNRPRFDALFDMRALPGWGTYTWTLSMVLTPYGELCTQTGSFLREPWWLEPFDNPLAPPFAN
jgi:hypothetical protein